MVAGALHAGIVVPSVTPFTESGALDEEALGRILDRFLEAGAEGVLLLGTTGEAASIPASVRRRVVEVGVGWIDGRARVWAGIGGNCLAEVVEAAAAYVRAGADALLAHAPFYYPLEAEDVRAWFEDLADEVPVPLFLYNIPMTTGLSIPPEVVRALADHPNVAGIKDSEYDLQRMEEMLAWTREREDFAYFTGPSAHIARAAALGADGAVPGAGNLMPGLCREIRERALRGETEEAERLQERLKGAGDTYMAGRGVGHSVAALKVGMSALGLCGPWVLPPLRVPDEAERGAIEQRVRAALAPVTEEAP